MIETQGWAKTFCAHVWPIEDLVGHELSPECVCGPEATEREFEGLELSVPVVVILHNSLDQREAHE